MIEDAIRERDAAFGEDIPKHWQAQLDRRTLLRLLDEARTYRPCPFCGTNYGSDV